MRKCYLPSASLCTCVQVKKFHFGHNTDQIYGAPLLFQHHRYGFWSGQKNSDYGRTEAFTLTFHEVLCTKFLLERIVLASTIFVCPHSNFLLFDRPPSLPDPELRGRLSPVDENVPGLDITFANGRDLFSFWFFFFCFLSIAFLTATLPPEAARAS